MKTTVTIKNLKCDCCKNTLLTRLSKVEGISSVKIDLDKGSLNFNYKTHNAMEGLRSELRNMGYPITK